MDKNYFSLYILQKLKTKFTFNEILESFLNNINNKKQLKSILEALFNYGNSYNITKTLIDLYDKENKNQIENKFLKEKEENQIKENNLLKRKRTISEELNNILQNDQEFIQCNIYTSKLNNNNNNNNNNNENNEINNENEKIEETKNNNLTKDLNEKNQNSNLSNFNYKEINKKKYYKAYFIPDENGKNFRYNRTTFNHNNSNFFYFRCSDAKCDGRLKFNVKKKIGTIENKHNLYFKNHSYLQPNYKPLKHIEIIDLKTIYYKNDKNELYFKFVDDPF